MKTRKGLFNYTTNEDGALVLNYKLYNTVIMKIKNDGIVLNSGGWKTNHTKNCINDNLPEGYKVYQKNFEWFVTTPDKTIPFVDGMKISQDHV